MGKLNLVIADNDTSYLESLWKYMQLINVSEVVLIHKFTSREALESFLEQRKRGDIQEINVLLVRPDLLPLSYITPKGQENIDIAMILFLTDNPVDSNEYTFPQVYKYLTADALLKKVTDLYLKKMQINSALRTSQQRSTCLALFSPSGGAGKTTLSLALAKTLGQEGKRVLYVNLESTNSLNKLLPNQTGASASQLLLYIQDEEADSMRTNEKIQEAIARNDELNLDYLNLFDNSFHILDLSKKNLISLMKLVLNMSLYDFIIIDLESSLNARTITVLEEICDRFFWVHGTLDDNYHQMKSQQLEKDIDNLSYERSQKYIKRCIPVINRYYYGDTEILGQTVMLKIPYTRDIFNLEKGFSNQVDGINFWRGVSQIALTVSN
ncbi:hypothetical protein DP73_03820 [Desulfosporosinus sp. HMP52]|uniref:AAA family ATPase n=1 Tax=Desulfosporosinus sp. HMP52 TaxID=1487923 RepID=UPI00051FC672|nr:AAA family ATPase [Desulfosporosinus sp. HMP52]KGK91402.1 hypothetical protein DP73_03820 [Desulfosporosinus sp. HMP52]